MAANPNASKLKNAGAAAYWGYKAFQAIRVCSGDVTALAELAGELLGEGLCAGVAANPGVIVDAIESMVSLHGGVLAFRKNVNNFAKFSGALSNQLSSSGNGADGAAMASAERVYRLFMECDSDKSGGVSMEEYVVFCSREGVPRVMAETMFFQADVDGNGQISFEEWTAMMNGRVGRARDSFNCGGMHGLSQYNAPFNGLTCDFCSKPILAGSLATGCRRCDCDACAECSGITPHLPPPPLPAEIPVAIPLAPLSSKDPGGTFNCRGRHGLALFAAPSYLACDWCSRSLPMGSAAVGCRACDCDACMECAAANLGVYCASYITCPGRHELVSSRAMVHGYSCDLCGLPVLNGSPIFSCRACGVDVCVMCIWKDHQRALTSGNAFACPGNHQLQTVHVMTHQQLATHKCSWCLAPPTFGARILWCDFCNVGVCNACLASSSAKAAAMSSAPPTTSRPPPPSYHDFAAPPPAGDAAKPSSSQPPGPPPPPSYSDIAGPDCSPERETPARAAMGSPFPLDSVVRVMGVHDEEINGKLMTVIGFEPDGGGNGGDESGVSVLQRRSKVYRIAVPYVFKVID